MLMEKNVIVSVFYKHECYTGLGEGDFRTVPHKEMTRITIHI